MVAVVPGHEKHARLSLSGWNERRSQEVQGANPVGENDPGEHGTMDAMMEMRIKTLQNDINEHI